MDRVLGHRPASKPYAVIDTSSTNAGTANEDDISYDQTALQIGDESSTNSDSQDVTGDVSESINAERSHNKDRGSKGEFVKWYGFCSVWKCICIIIICKHSPVTQCRPDIHLLLIQPWQCNIPLLSWCMAYITAARQLAMKVCNVAYIALFHVTDDFIAIQFSYFVAGKRDWVQLACFFVVFFLPRVH